METNVTVKRVWLDWVIVDGNGKSGLYLGNWNAARGYRLQRRFERTQQLPESLSGFSCGIGQQFVWKLDNGHIRHCHIRDGFHAMETGEDDNRFV